MLDVSISGDELEQNRVQLERNLRQRDISLQLSTPEDQFDDESVEYPRRNPGTTPLSDFGSLIRPSRRDLGDDDNHGWSYGIGEDEEQGISPFGGQTVSTTGHHASNVTLNAGLGGRRTGRRDASFTGTEYDPDRPLTDLLAGLNSKLSVFDNDTSRSRYTVNYCFIFSSPLLTY